MPNRLMPPMSDGNDCVYLLDPTYLSTSYLSGIQGYDLAKTGLSNKKMLASRLDREVPERACSGNDRRY